MTEQRIYKDLYECLAQIDSPELIEKLLDDICTYTEKEHMAQRLHCAKLLRKGYTYQQIIEITDISSATLSRVSRCLQHGSGGYLEVVDKIIDGEDDGKA